MLNLVLGIAVVIFIVQIYNRAKGSNGGFLFDSKSSSSVNWRNTLIGFFCGVLFFVIFLYPMSPENMPSHQLNPLSFLGYFLFGSLMELGKSAANEEMMMRGFLWGFLKKFGWGEVWILFIQTLLFMPGHLIYRENFYALFNVFLAGLLLGYLAWKTKTIGTSIIAHAVVNSLYGIYYSF